METIVAFVAFVISVAILLAFFDMVSNLRKCVELLRGIYKELKEANAPVSKGGGSKVLSGLDFKAPDQ
jgi:hypothetical protein